MFWRIVLYSVAAIALYHVIQNYIMNPIDSCGCNIEDDDIRRDALLSRVENKKKEKVEMEKELQTYLQDTMESLNMQ